VFKRLTTADLWTVAVIVWGIAVLVGVFVGMPLLLGLNVDAGLMVNGLVAVGTFSAAGAALWIATSDRRQRTHERDAADHAQARLVTVDVVPVPRTPDITVAVKNYGARSILDITSESVEAEDFPSAQFIPQLRWVNVIEPNRDNPHGAVLHVRPADEPTRRFMQGRWFPVPQGNDPRPTVPLDRAIAATVRFTDANGNRWQTTFELRGQRATLVDGSVETVGVDAARIAESRIGRPATRGADGGPTTWRIGLQYGEPAPWPPGPLQVSRRHGGTGAGSKH
jgi:hypothetical protein